jgi:succinate dehydrogenase / fumarate reductase flavoprotein subunit
MRGQQSRPSDEEVRAAAKRALAPFDGEGEENPYTLQHDLQAMMQRLVGIIRTADELQDSLREIETLKQRAKKVSVEGHRQYNPGWHLALDLTNMLIVSECIARAALEREESRGGHTRDDFPTASPAWGAKNLALTLDGETVQLRQQPLPVMPDDLKPLFD